MKMCVVSTTTNWFLQQQQKQQQTDNVTNIRLHSNCLQTRINLKHSFQCIYFLDTFISIYNEKNKLIYNN